MESWYRIQSALIAAIICLALAINVLLRGRRNLLWRRFAWFNLNLVGFFLVDALALSEALGPKLGVSARAAVASFLPATCLGFFTGFVASKTGQGQTIRRMAVLGSLALFASVVTGWPPSEDVRQWLLFGCLAVALAVSLGQMLVRHQALESRVDRARLKYVTITGAAVFSLLLVEYVPGLHVPSAGSVLTALYMFFLFQVVTRRRIIDIFEFLGRFVVLGGFAIVLSVLYVLLVAWWRHDFGLFLFNTAIASIVILILFDPLRSLVEEKLNQLVFREKFEFTRQTDEIRTGLQAVIEIQALAGSMMEALERSRRVTHACIYLGGEDGLAYLRLGHVGAAPPERLDAIKARPFLARLQEDKLLALENLEAERAEREKRGVAAEQGHLEVLDSILQTMRELESALVIGFLSRDQLLGFLGVKDERLREAYGTDEIKALVALAAQATITIENSRHFEAIRERDRLAALGEMAAGLAHEIRNPLGAIKGAAQLLKENVESVEDAGDVAKGGTYLDVIQEEVDRLNGVVSQFLTYARPLKGSGELIDVNQVLERTLTLIDAEEHPCEVVFHPAPNLPPIRSEPELVRQITLNLARNAIEAMGEAGGTLTVSTALTRRRAPTWSDRMSFVRIRLEDEGPGIPPEVMERLFIPFFTTKASGTGLGLAICQRIVRSLGGSIEVSSRLGAGTTFTVLLPAGGDTRVTAA